MYAAGREGVTAEIVIKQFKTKYPGEDLDLVFGEDSDYDTGRKVRLFYSLSGTRLELSCGMVL